MLVRLTGALDHDLKPEVHKTLFHFCWKLNQRLTQLALTADLLLALEEVKFVH